MLGWILFGVAAYAACLWGNWLAIGNAVANFWSLGVMEDQQHAGPIGSGGERFAVLVNIATSLVGIALLLARLGQR